MKLMFNEDWVHYIWTRRENGVDITERELRDFIYQYKTTQVTDFAINVNGSVSTYPSRVWQSWSDKYLAETECGIPVNYKDTYAQAAYEVFNEKNLDMFKIWIEAAREVGIRPWISIRMNDCHGNGNDPELRQSEYIIKHPEQWRIRHRAADEYYDHCLDFEQEAVRNHLLAYIEEALERYRPDGLELDFSRETHMFVPGREQKGQPYLDDMMRKIRALADKYSPDGTKIPISVLINGTAQTNLEMGLDPSLWAKEGLIDAVVNIGRWTTTNTDMEIKLWKKLLGERVIFGCGQQSLLNTDTSVYTDTMSSGETAFGQAAANLYNGADFVYLYNYMDEPTPDIRLHSTAIREKNTLRRILENIGDYETVLRQRRTHVLTFDDFCPDWKPPVSRLPISFRENQREFIKILTGEVRQGEKAQVVLGFDKELSGDDLEVYVNSVPVKFAGNTGLDENLTKAVPCAFDIENTDEIGGNTVIEIKLYTEARLEFAQIAIGE